MGNNRRITRRTFLSYGNTLILSTLALSKGISTSVFADEAPLRERAAAKGLIYGGEVNQDHIAKDAAFAARFLEECAILVPGNELKMGPLRPNQSTFNFAPGDFLFEFARTNKLLFRGHTLVWHNQLPSWFQSTVNSQNAKQILTEHISTVVKHYAGKVHSWDVVNEVINPPDGRSDGLRNTPWLQLLGPDYIDLAFRTAAEADPKALLVYNDFGLDYDTPPQEAKRKAAFALLQRLKASSTPIHALGMQAHLNGNETRFSASKLQSFLRQVADLGLKILITELDVSDQNLPADIASRDSTIAKAYEDYLTAVLAEPAVIGVLTWGLSDRYTWLSSFAPRSDGLAVRPLPLDTELKRKPAWNAIASALDNAPKR